MPGSERSDAIRRAVEQARLELGIQGKSPPPRRVSPRKARATLSQSQDDEINSTSDIALENSQLETKLEDDIAELRVVSPVVASPAASPAPSEYAVNGYVSSFKEEPSDYDMDSEAKQPEPNPPAVEPLTIFAEDRPETSAGHAIFSVEERSDPSTRYEVWVRQNCSWEELQEAIAKRMKLFEPSSVLSAVLVDASGDVLSPSVTTSSKFFKIYSNYEEGMKFIVDIDCELEKERKAQKELEEFRSLAMKLTFRHAETGDQHLVYVERSCLWESLTKSVCEEFDTVEPQWIKHIIVEDCDGDEITPPLNSAEKFWRFARSASMHNGDVFVFDLDEARMRKDFERREHEAFVARCEHVQWKVSSQGSGSESLSSNRSESLALIPRGADWDEIRHHFAKSNPDTIKFSDWITRMILLDHDGDDLSPPIDGELLFWKVMKAYDLEARMVFELTLDQAKIRAYEEEAALEEFRKASKHFKVCLANHKGAELTDIYVPHNCNWQELTEGVSAFLRLSDPSWIDYFVLLDTEGDPLTPPLNSAEKFWKMGQKLSSSSSMSLYVHLKAEASQKLEEEEFIANACAFRVKLDSDESRDGYVHVAPDSDWSAICARVADALLLESADWISSFVLIDSDDGEVLSPALKSAEKFWRFYKKHEGKSTFRVFEDEVLIARAVAEKAQKLQSEKEREEQAAAAAMASKRQFQCRLMDTVSNGTEDPVPIRGDDLFNVCVENGCGWSDVLNAIANTKVVEADFIDHLRLVDSQGIVISVPIKNAKLFWKFAGNIDPSQKPVFDIHVNHSYRSKVVKRRAEEAIKKSLLLIHVSLANEDMPDEVLLPANASWEEITEAIASSVEKTEIEPQWISHLTLFDIDGDQLSPELDTSDKVWGTMPLYRVEESMVYLVALDPVEMEKSAKLKEEQLFRESAKHFRMRLTPTETLYAVEKVVMLPPNCLWQDVVNTITNDFDLDSPSWVDYLVLYDEEGDELSKHIDNMTLFWKTASTYAFEEKKMFMIFLSMREIEQTRAEQKHAAFMAVAEHIPLVLASNTKCVGTLHLMLNSSWDSVCETILEEMHLEQPKSIAKLHLVDEEYDELSPPIQTSEKFWKIYQQNFQAGANMAFAVHTSNRGSLSKSGSGEARPVDPWANPVRRAVVQEPTTKATHANRVTSTIAPVGTSASGVATPTCSNVEAETFADKAATSTEEMLELASTESNCSQFAEATPEMVSSFHQGCENGMMSVVRNSLEVIKIDPNVKNANLSTGMHFACLKGQKEVAKFLYESGCDVDVPNAAGLTPFDCACVSGDLSVCEWLFSLGIVDLTFVPNVSPQTPTPALHHAAINGHNEVVLWLITKKVNLEVKSSFGTTALMEAAHVGHFNIVITLCAAGANVMAHDADGITAFHLACVEGHMDVVRFLSSKGVDVNHQDKNNKTPFMYACSGGHLDIAKWLKTSGANVFAKGGFHDKQNTSLHLAAQSGSMETVKWLVEECNLDPRALNEKNATAADFAHSAGHQNVANYLRSCTDAGRFNVDDLEQALEQDDFGMAKQILERVIEGHSNELELPYGTSPLHYVAASGHVELAQFLIMGGASVNCLSDVGRTPLHYAAFKGCFEMAKYLYGVGANPNLVDHYGYTGLSIARKNGNAQLTSWLTSVTTEPCVSPVKSEASSSVFFSCVGTQQEPIPQVSNFGGGSATDMSVHRFSRQMEPLSMAPNPLSDELHVACKAGDLNRAKSLLESGAPINSKSGPHDPSPLHYAVMSGNLALVQYLLDKGAHLNDQNVKGSAAFEVDDADSGDHEAMTPLHIACDKKNQNMVMFLIKKGADLNMKNKAGDTPLHIVCLLGQHQLLQQIIDLPRSILPSLNLDVRSSHLLNLLHCAADAGSLETAQILVDNEVGVNSFDDEKKTPLHYACGSGSLEVATLLLNKGAIVDLQDTSSRTPLLYACCSGNVNLVEYLVGQGASLDSTTNKGNSPLHIACKYGNLRLVQWLVSNGLDVNQRNSDNNLPVYYAGLNGFTDIVEWLETKMGHSA